jgi:hypothetical protein
MPADPTNSAGFMSALGHKQTLRRIHFHVRFTPESGHPRRERHVRFVKEADRCSTATSAEPHREWCCYPEATPYEFLSAKEIEARAATKRNPKPSTYTGRGWGVCWGSLLPHLGF